ncbi:MAG: M23 family metallopeptidase [Bacteroidota bacterium]
MAKRIRYYYDEESCTFQEEKASPRSILKKTLVILACCGMLGYFFFYDDPKDIYLKAQNEQLKAELQVLNQSLALIEEQVDKLHNEDNKFYRSLLAAEPIDEGSWNGGTGGAMIQDESAPKELKDPRDRMKRLLRKVDIQDKSYTHLHELMTSNDYRIRHTPAIRPVRGTVISGFGQRMHPLQKIRKMHWGIDMQASMGTPIISSADGKVTLVRKSKGGYGNQIEITHGSTGYVSKYAHMKEIHVKKGQTVKRGESIGLSGNSGLSKGPHLHYEIILNGSKVDPVQYFYGGMNKADYAKLKELAKRDTESMD